ncbi:MAG TPA: glycan-binding surface protein [Chitinophagaceae bacterium]|nr:glycan-binding surface protein [Chitinophagaceae bacterium]
MKNKWYGISFQILFLLITAALVPACKKTMSGSAPTITRIRNYAASPNDTLVTSITLGQWVVIQGQNLKNAVQILVDGVPVQFNYTLFADDKAVIQIPSAIPFNNVEAADLNTVKYYTTDGSVTYSFGVNTPPATITGNSLSSKDKVGDSVHIYGTNLFLIKSLTIAGVSISPFSPASDGSSIGFTLPVIAKSMPWQGVIVAASGTYNFDISIVPLISGVSNANPSQGDSVYVYGSNLNGVISLNFAGIDITGFNEAADGSSVGFKAPSLSQSGPIKIVTSYGTATTVFNVNSQISTNGMLANMEWGNYFGWQWWGGAGLTVNSAANSGGWITVKTDLDGVLGTNNSMFVSYDKGVMPGGAGTSSDGTYNFPIGANQWVPVADLSDPVANWALQFEISVAHPWEGSTLCFVGGFAGNYMARYEPWQISASSTSAFTTKGWVTVTIPLTSFRASDPTLGDGMGASVTSLTNLLGSSGNTSLSIYLHNFKTSATATGFYAALDNVRVVKIK